MRLQQCGRAAAEFAVVVHNQDARSDQVDLGSGRQLGCACDHQVESGRQQQGHRGPQARRAVHACRASGLRAEAVDLAQAQAGALADFLGGEEGLEGALRHLGRHAGAGIGDGDQHAMPCRHIGRALGLGVLGIAGLHLQLAARGHGVACVEGQIDERELQLTGVHVDRPGSSGHPHRNLDAAPEHTVQQRLKLRQVPIEMHALRRQGPAPGHAQQVLREAAARLHGAQRGRDRRLQVGRVCMALDQVGAVADHTQQVVEVVRDATGEAPEGLDTLALGRPLLGLARSLDCSVDLALEFVAMILQGVCGLGQRCRHIVELGDPGAARRHRFARPHARGDVAQRLDGRDDAARHQERPAHGQRQQQKCANDHLHRSLRYVAGELALRHRGDVGPIACRSAEVADHRQAIQRNGVEERLAARRHELLQVARGTAPDERDAARMSRHHGTAAVEHGADPALRQSLRVDDALHFSGSQGHDDVEHGFAVALHRVDDRCVTIAPPVGRLKWLHARRVDKTFADLCRAPLRGG